MKVGIPREVKNHEYRVAITPSGVHELVVHGHEVFVEKDAGVGSSILDEDYTAAGATILDTADDVWGTGDLILKVKEPIEPEYHRMREGQTLFTYLHLAADKPLTEELVKRKVTGIAYETVELPDRSLPLLAPMSEVAGRLAPQVGAQTLMRAQGGRGVLMGGVSGVYAAKVVVIGAGVSGMNAAAIALGMQAEVLLLDRLLHLEHELRRPGLRGGADDRRARLAVLLVGVAGADAGARLDVDAVAAPDEGVHPRGRHGDAEFVVLDLCGHADVHGDLRILWVELPQSSPVVRRLGRPSA